jgi:hypothetical protein
MGPYRIHATPQLIVGDLSTGDLRRIQDAIGVMMRLRDSWQAAECENGVQIAFTNTDSFHWGHETPAEVCSFLSENGGKGDLGVISAGVGPETFAILTSTLESVVGLSKEDLRSIQDCISMFVLSENWSGCEFESGIKFVIADSQNETHNEEAGDWLTEQPHGAHVH